MNRLVLSFSEQKSSSHTGGGARKVLILGIGVPPLSATSRWKTSVQFPELGVDIPNSWTVHGLPGLRASSLLAFIPEDLDLDLTLASLQ